MLQSLMMKVRNNVNVLVASAANVLNEASAANVLNEAGNETFKDYLSNEG